MARGEWGVIEPITIEDVVAERHRGIRPGFGYPACPDHSEKFKLFELLDASAIGITLTENAAMAPAASVSGLYFAHPRARYFSVGRIAEDQVVSYARRKGQAVDEVERWLSSSLAYESAASTQWVARTHIPLSFPLHGPPSAPLRFGAPPGCNLAALGLSGEDREILKQRSPSRSQTYRPPYR